MNHDQTSTGAAQRRGLFRAGDRVQLTDPRGRLHTITLAEGASFHTHRGYLSHDALLGEPEGSVVRNTAGIEYLVVEETGEIYGVLSTADVERAFVKAMARPSA